MPEDKMKYADHIEESKKKWTEATPKEKELYQAVLATLASDFVFFWDFLKTVEKKFDIDAMGIARELRWKHCFAAGQRLAKKSESHGVKDLYDAYNSQFEGLVGAKWLECNDKAFHKWNFDCPVMPHLKNLGLTEDEMKEMAPLFCLADEAIMKGFNPELEVFPQPALLMAGDSHCAYRTEDHRGED